MPKSDSSKLTAVIRRQLLFVRPLMLPGAVFAASTAIAGNMGYVPKDPVVEPIAAAHAGDYVMPHNSRVTLGYGIEFSQLGGWVDRGGAWNGPPSASQAGLDFNLNQVVVSGSAHFDSGAHIGVHIGKVTDFEGQTYGYNGQDAIAITDGDGTLYGVSGGMPLGNGLGLDLAMTRYDVEGTRYTTLSNNVDNCPVDVSSDNCSYTHQFFVFDVGMNYRAPLSNNMFYALNGGLRFVNGYNKVSVWNDNAPIGGTFDAADQSLNVSPMFAVDPRVGAVIGYELGNYDLTASAEYFGSELSFGIGLELATGRHNQAAGAHSLYWGGFVESNQFAMDRAHPWVAEAKLPSDLGSFDLDSTSVGVFVEAVTQSSSFRVGFGTVTSAEARVYRSSHNLGDNGDPSSPNAIMSDGSGHHINVAFSQNVMPVGSGNLRADMEFDYQKLDFNMIEQPNGGNKANKVYTAGTAQVATFAVGPTYSQKVTNGIEAYVGLDYLIGAGRFVMTTTGGDNSNYNAMFEESARVRVGADFSVGSGMGRVEISGNSDAGASVAASYSMTF